MKKFEVIRVSGVTIGVGFDTGGEQKDADESEKWATAICEALNKHYQQ